jgi:hypothetical protein
MLTKNTTNDQMHVQNSQDVIFSDQKAPAGHQQRRKGLVKLKVMTIYQYKSRYLPQAVFVSRQADAHTQLVQKTAKLMNTGMVL